MDKNKRRGKTLFILVAALVVSVFVGIPVTRALLASEEVEPERPPTPVTVTVPRRGLAERTVRYPANLSPETMTPVLSKVTGRITSLPVVENQQVAAGEVIATIEDDVLALQVRQAESALRAARAQYRQAIEGVRQTEVEIAQADLDLAEASLETARGNLDRTRRLFDAGTVARADFEEAQDRFESAQTQVENARRRISLMEDGATAEQIDLAQANVEAAERQLELAELQLSYSRVTAPVAGTVATVLVEEGQSVGRETTLVALVNDRLIFATAAVPERLYGRFLGREGEMAVRIFPEAYREDPPFRGTVSSVASIVDRQSRTFAVEVAIPNEDGRLRPGMFVTAEFVVEAVADALLLEDVAVYEREGEQLVFTVEDGVAVARPVVVTQLSAGMVVITSGLGEGIPVVAEGGAFLETGMAVRVVDP